MDEARVREHAEAFCASLAAGNIDRAIEDVSAELKRNLGEVLSLFPLPLTEAAVGAIDRGGSSITVTLRLVGETEEAMVQTRWKDRDGRPTIIEASHLSRVERPTAAPTNDEADAAGA
jgi:hypothetical protein